MATEIDEDARTSTISPNKTFTYMLRLVHRPRSRASSIFLSSCAACSVISSVRRTIPPELHRQERASS
jgi:hypothetical protein